MDAPSYDPDNEWKLTEMQWAFACWEVAGTTSAAEAARRAGYKTKTSQIATNKAYTLRKTPKIRAFITHLTDQSIQTLKQERSIKNRKRITKIDIIDDMVLDYYINHFDEVVGNDKLLKEYRMIRGEILDEMGITSPEKSEKKGNITYVDLRPEIQKRLGSGSSEYIEGEHEKPG